jgi:hypothetical protein
MEQKNRAVTMLLAAGALLGLDRAIALLQNERTLVQQRIDEGRKLTLGDLADAANGHSFLPEHGVRRSRPSKSPARVAQALTQAALETVKFNPRPKRRKYTRKASTTGPNPVNIGWNGSLTDAQRICKKVVAAGPKPIKVIVRALMRARIVPDTKPDTRKQVDKFLRGDKTFSIRTSGVFGLRSRSV